MITLAVKSYLSTGPELCFFLKKLLIPIVCILITMNVIDNYSLRPYNLDVVTHFSYYQDYVCRKYKTLVESSLIIMKEGITRIFDIMFGDQTLNSKLVKTYKADNYCMNYFQI